ncbi:MAG TPA: hypothetical protein VIR16_01295 [Candidatus Limnocylindrales bacterium]
MRAIDLVRGRQKAVTASLLSAVEAVRGLDLATPVLAGTSPLGLTLWHVPRTQDWLVQTCLRGETEVAEAHLDGLPDPERFGFGTGLTPEGAAEAAAAVRLDRLAAYAQAVGETIDAWLATLDDADLDAVPPFDDRQRSRRAYSTPGALAEVAGLGGLPAGTLLVRPAFGHVLRHLGEVDVLAPYARARTRGAN